MYGDVTATDSPTPELPVSSPLSCEALPEGGGAIMSECEHPGVGKTLGLGADADVGVQSKAQQQAAQQDCVVLTLL